MKVVDPSRKLFEVATRLVAVAVVVAFSAAGCRTSDVPVGSPTAPSSSSSSGSAQKSGSAGCGRPVDVPRIAKERPGDVAFEFPAGNVARRYRLAIPREYSPQLAVPLVVALHGSGSNALQASVYSDVPRAATDRGMIVVTPDAIDGKWQLGPTGTDADFIEHLVDDIEARFCIDTSRVNLIGMSLGAWKAAAQACGAGSRYASVALVAVEVFPGKCPMIPVLAFHGTADPVVAYGAHGGTVDAAATPNSNIPGTQYNVSSWARHNGCAVEPTKKHLGDDIVKQSYRRCRNGADVVLYTIVGGGHTWPGSDINLGAASLTTHTISATGLALDWFTAHPRRVHR